MPNKLTIRVQTFPTNNPDVPGEQKTVSKILLEPGDHVTFQNRATSEATVEFEPDMPLCKGGNEHANPFTIPVGLDSDKLNVCKAGEFEYTSTVGGALPEDPILIVERSVAGPGTDKKPIIFPEGTIALLVGLAVGAIVGYLLGRRRVARRN